MDTETSNAAFFKSRSLPGRLSVAFKFINGNFRYLLRQGSFILLPMCVIQALYAAYFRDAATLSAGNVMALSILILLSLAGSGLFGALIFTSLQEYIELGYVPAYKLKEIKTSLLKNMRRLVSMWFVMFVCLFILLAACGALLNLSLYTMIITIPLLLFVLVPLAYAIFIYIFEGKDLIASIKKSFGLGVPNWGSTFVVSVLMSALAVVVQIVASLPWITTVLVENLARLSVLQGNEANLPGFFPVLVFVLAMVATFISILSGGLLGIIPMAFQYGSIEARRKEEEEIVGV